MNTSTMAIKTAILLKLGGSVITDKNSKNTLRKDVLGQLVGEIYKFRSENPGQFLIVGHGQGSFAHFPAKQYQTKAGFVSSDSRFGMAITQFTVGQLHQLVLAEMLRQKLPAVSFRVNSSAIARNSKQTFLAGEVLLENLNQGLLPVTSGDVLVDSLKGCTVWSTEIILEEIARFLLNHDLKVSRIVHVTDVAGVIDGNGKTIPEISPDDVGKVKNNIVASNKTDVTGGMWHKIESCLGVSGVGIESVIITGLVKNNLYNCLSGKNFIGTTIKSN